MQNKLFSNTRLPLDHLLSGALIGGISGFALGYTRTKNKQIAPAQAIKEAAKLALDGGVVTSAAIGASNAIVNGEYLKAAAYATGGALALIAIEKVLTKDKI